MVSRSLCFVVLLSFLSSTIVVASPSATLEAEKARLDQKKAQVAEKQLQARQLQEQIAYLNSELEKVERSGRGSFFVPALAITGLIAVGTVVSVSQRGRIPTEIGIALMTLIGGGALTIVSATVAGVSGYRLYVRKGEEANIKAMFAVISAKLAERLQQLKADRQELAAATLNVCLLEGNASGDCHDAYVKELELINASGK